MRFTASSMVVLAFAFGLTAAPIPKGKMKDEEAIQGTWQVEKLDLGKPLPIDVTAMKLTFKEGKMTMSMAGQPGKEGEYKIDSEAKIKAIDFVDDGKRSSPGIYELDGDTLKICIAEGNGAVRPTEMKSDGNRIAVITLKRVKEEKKDK